LGDKEDEKLEPEADPLPVKGKPDCESADQHEGPSHIIGRVKGKSIFQCGHCGRLFGA